MLGLWRIDQSRVWSYEIYPPPKPDEKTQGVADMVVLPVFVFSFSNDGVACLVHEVNTDGRRRRTVFALPQGINSAAIGSISGVITVDSVSIKNPWHPMSRLHAAVARMRAEGGNIVV